ncbi:MAG: HNH endonuclease [Kofleriaceae bacterium]|nr:HNH endonuclease [Kofleriaceae bacterium]
MFDRDDERVDLGSVFDGAAGSTGADRAPPADDWRRLDRALRGIARRRAALDAEEARCLVAAQRLALHRRFGHATLAEYLERTLGYGPRAARERLRVATALQTLPEIADALGRGVHSYSAVRELTRVGRDDTEAAWLAAAAGKTVHEIEAMVAGRRPGDLPGAEVDPTAVRRSLSLEVGTETLALWRDARLALELERGGAVSDDELLATMCREMLGGGRVGAPDHAGGDASPAGRAAYQIALTVCPTCDRTTQDGGGRAIEVPPAVGARARCDATVLGRVDGDDVGRAVQTVPPRIRRAVIARDHGRCRVPGCRSSRFIEVHHIQPRAQGGRHTVANLISLCGGHHDAVHVGRLQIAPAASGEPTFTHADGRPYGAPSPSPTTPRRHERRVSTEPSRSASHHGPLADVEQALRGLGFPASEARAATDACAGHLGQPLAELVRRALRAAHKP